MAINHVGGEDLDGGHVSTIGESVERSHPSQCNQYVRTRGAIVGMDTVTTLEEKIMEDKYGVYDYDRETTLGKELPVVVIVQISVGELQYQGWFLSARKIESLTITGNGMIEHVSLAETSSNVVKVCGLGKEFQG